jgi:hypothetical protein
MVMALLFALVRSANRRNLLSSSYIPHQSLLESVPLYTRLLMCLQIVLHWIIYATVIVCKTLILRMYKSNKSSIKNTLGITLPQAETATHVASKSSCAILSSA